MESSVLFKKDNDVFSKVAQFYERTEKSLKDDVKIIKNWMESQPHFPEILDNDMIQNFLLLNKCSIEKTKQRIDMYYTLRSQLPDFYDKINPKLPNIQQEINISCWATLPQLTEEMYRVTVYKLLDKDQIDNLDPYDVFRALVNIYEIRLKEDIVYGDVFIVSFEGIDFNYMTKLTPSFIAKMFTIYEKIFSIPLKGLYLVNAPSYISILLSIMKSVMKPKLFQRVYSCQDISILDEHFSKKMLPKDFGGEERSVKELHELVKQKFKQYQSRFDELDKLRIDESRRPEELRNDEILGFHGNFKKLDVD